MQPVLERGSIDNPLIFDVGLIQLSFIPVCSPNTQHFSQIAQRVCTLVLLIIIIINFDERAESSLIDYTLLVM